MRERNKETTEPSMSEVAEEGCLAATYDVTGGFARMNVVEGDDGNTLLGDAVGSGVGNSVGISC